MLFVQPGATREIVVFEIASWIYATSLRNPVPLLTALPLLASSLAKLQCRSLLNLLLFCSGATEVCSGAERASLRLLGLRATAAPAVVASGRK